MEYSPIFESIMQKLRVLPTSEYDTPHNKKLFALAMKYAPPELTEMFINGAQEKGLFPKATHCDTDGNPLYSLDEIARFYGQTPEEAQQALDELTEFMPDLQDQFYHGDVHRFN